MSIKIMSIKEAEKNYINKNIQNIYFIIISSYNRDIVFIPSKNKIILSFQDTTIQKFDSFNNQIANKIIDFTKKIDFSKNTLVVCCDGGISRSAAVAAAILRKQKGNYKAIFKNCKYTPNILVFKILCFTMGLKTNKLYLKYLQYINKKAFKKAIKGGVYHGFKRD